MVMSTPHTSALFIGHSLSFMVECKIKFILMTDSTSFCCHLCFFLTVIWSLGTQEAQKEIVVYERSYSTLLLDFICHVNILFLI